MCGALCTGGGSGDLSSSMSGVGGLGEGGFCLTDDR